MIVKIQKHITGEAVEDGAGAIEHGGDKTEENTEWPSKG